MDHFRVSGNIRLVQETRYRDSDGRYRVGGSAGHSLDRMGWPPPDSAPWCLLSSRPLDLLCRVRMTRERVTVVACRGRQGLICSLTGHIELHLLPLEQNVNNLCTIVDPLILSGKFNLLNSSLKPNKLFLTEPNL